MTTPDSGVPPTRVRVRLGYPAAAGAAAITVVGVDAPLVCLGVDEPGGRETTAWYAPGNVLTAGGVRWRVLSTSPPPRLTPDAPPGSAGDHIVAVLVPVGDLLSPGPGPRRAP